MKLKLHKLMGNLVYVHVDRVRARKHWWDMVEFSQLDAATYSINRTMVVSQKAVAGILSHRQTRGFVMHRMRERALLRRLKRDRVELVAIPLICDRVLP